MENRNRITHIEMETLLEKYLKTLTPKEKKAYDIAKSHLGCSFDLSKSNGYLQWKKNENAANENVANST